MSIIRTKGDMDALARKSGGSAIEQEESVMTDTKEDFSAPGESIRITMDSFNGKGERTNRIIAEWHGLDEEEANLFGVTIASAVFDVVDGFKEVKNQGEIEDEVLEEYQPIPDGFTR